MSQPAVELDGIWKRFPGVIANAGAGLTVRPGTVLYELAGVSEQQAKVCFARVAHKMPIKVRLVKRRPA